MLLTHHSLLTIPEAAGAGTDPSTLSGLVFYADPDDATKFNLTDVLINSFTDSIAGIVFTAATTQRPTRVAGLNSKYGISFDGGDRLLTSTRLDSFATEISIIMVADLNDAAAVIQRLFHIYSDGTNKSQFLLTVNVDNDDYATFGSRDNTSVKIDKNSYLAGYGARIFMGTAKEADKVYTRINGNESAGTITSGTFAGAGVDGAVIGANSTTAANPCNGEIYRIYLYNRVLTPEEKTDCELWLKNYYSISF